MSEPTVDALASVRPIRRVDLLQVKPAVFVFSKALKAITPPTFRAHEVQAEAVEVRLGVLDFQLSAAANADPHARMVAQGAAHV